MKTTTVSPQNLIRFSLIAFVIGTAGFFLQENANAQNFSAGNLWRDTNKLIVGNSGNTQPFLTAANSYSGGASIGSGTLDLGGQTMNVSAIELADGSKIINGTILLDNDFIVVKEIKQELQFLGVVPNQNGTFDLGADPSDIDSGLFAFSAVKFENGGQIINGTIAINANNPAGPVVRELPAHANN